MFKDFKGIEKEREEKVNTSNLDYLLEICDEVVVEHKKVLLKQTEDKDLSQLCTSVYEQIKKTIDFSEQDLKDLIFTKANKDFEIREAQAIGIYTGILLQILTERNKEEGKKTRFYINGKGNKFDYLFHSANIIGDLIVENFRGKFICAFLEKDDAGDSINVVAGIGLEGDWALSACGSKNSEDIVIGKNIKGDSALEGTGVGSRTGMALAQDIEGDSVFFATAARGKTNFVFAENINGDNALERAGSDEGKIDVIYARNISGEYPLNDAGRGEFKEDVEYEKGDIGLVLYDMPGKRLNRDVNARRIISHRSKKLFPKLVSDYKIRQFYKVLEPIDNVSVEGKFAILDQIKALYESIRPKKKK
jgi:hypothetical protein